MTLITLETPAYVLRTCNHDMTSRGGFVWSENGYVEAPDWIEDANPGHGLHGALWGEGNGALFSLAKDARWLVVEINHYIDLGGKVKFRCGKVVFCGDQLGATEDIKNRGGRGAVIGSTVTVGDYGVDSSLFFPSNHLIKM